MTHIVYITDSNLGDGSHERDELGTEFDVTMLGVRTEREVLEQAADAEGLLVQWAPVTAAVLDGLPRLRAVVRYGIGLDNIDVAAAADRGIMISNVDDYCIDEVADHAIASIVSHNRRLAIADRAVRAGQWDAGAVDPPQPVDSDPVGVAGFGRIGRAVAARASILGFPVVVWDPYLGDAPEDVEVVPHIEELAARCRHLTLHVPATAETAGLMNREVLRQLGPHGHLVNTSRGSLVDEDALLDALDAGDLGFASLDVLSTEPPTGTANRLTVHPRTLVTPHLAYLSTRSLPTLRIRAAQRLADLLTARA